MIQISILEDDDLICPCDYCRPLNIEYSESDSVFTESTYGGTPINNMKWVQVRYVFGPGWYGKKIKELYQPSGWQLPKYEFMKGQLPKGHLLNVSKHIPLDM